MPRSDYYIPIFDELPGHKKTRDLRMAMGWNRFEVVGFLAWFWLQVAADFPNGELPGLDDLNATLREIWSAAKFKLDRKCLQLVAEALVEVGFIDIDDESGRVVMHDWEDGAGMFAVKRLYERERKRQQRFEARQNVENDVPGTPDVCPDDVPGEKGKRKRKTIPPNPPQAGGDCGDFSEFQKSVKDAWREACARVPVDVIDDNKTTQGVASLAKQLMAGKITMDQVRNGMAEFLRRKYRGAEDVKSRMASWGLNTVAKNPSAYQPIGGVAPTDRPATVLVEYRCDQCGETTTARVSAGDARPFECTNQPRRGETCSGMFHPLGEVVRS